MRLFHAVAFITLCLIPPVAIIADGQTTSKQTTGKKKFEVPKDAVAGKVKAVDMAKPSFTISVEKGKDRVFLVDKATKFWGPKGGDRGTGPEGLKDDCMAVGYEIKVNPSKDGKTANNVYLPVRKDEPKKTDAKKTGKV